MLKSKYILTLGICISLAACQNVSHQDAGVVTGGLVGGLIGSQFGGGTGKIAAAVGGAMLGAYLGGNIGKTMDKVDQMQMQRALETANTGQAVEWSNPDSGNHYTVRPTRTYYAHKQPCREYVTYAVIDGKQERVHGRACRQSNGNWHVVR